MKGRLSRLAGLRIGCGYTLRDVARMCGVSAETVRLWESGATLPDTLHGQRYAEVLGITQAQLNEFLAALRRAGKKEAAAK
jgi:transcriptional regulator with XRE-family HTH domain